MRVPLVLGDFIERAETVFPDRVAVVDEPGTSGLGELTYGQLASRARAMAAELESMGIGFGERVAIISPNSARFLIAMFGVSAYGRVLVPINFRLNTDEVRYIIEHSGARVLLIDPEVADTVADVACEFKILMDGKSDVALFGSESGSPSDWEADEDVTASINYTSGTTARPKGVQLIHRGLWLNAATFGWHVGVSDRDVYLHTLPMFHCNGWGMPYAAVGMGVKQVVLRKVDGEEILKRVEEHGVTFMCGAPAVVAMILDAAAARRERGEAVPGRDKVRIVVAGAPPPSKVIERVGDELGWEFIQIYGLTETSPLLTINRAPSEWDDLDNAERARRLSRAGVPAIGVRMDTDSDGEVLARSNNVFAGYWQQPEQTDAVLVDGWFKTGDGGFITDGFLTIADRKKDVIISGGENVSSIEVEDCLFQHPDIAECAVIGVPHDKWGETILALVVLRPGSSATDADIIEHCRAKMAHFKCPTGVEFRDELPRTATGKLQKFKLRAAYWEGREKLVN